MEKSFIERRQTQQRENSDSCFRSGIIHVAIVRSTRDAQRRHEKHNHRIGIFDVGKCIFCCCTSTSRQTISLPLLFFVAKKLIRKKKHRRERKIRMAKTYILYPNERTFVQSCRLSSVLGTCTDRHPVVQPVAIAMFPATKERNGDQNKNKHYD